MCSEPCQISDYFSRALSEPGGTRWRTGGEVKRKQANGVCSQYNSTLPRNVVCPALLPLLLPIRILRLPVVDWTDTPTDLNGLVRFGERRILVSAGVPSRSRTSYRILSSCCNVSLFSVRRKNFPSLFNILNLEIALRS